MGKKREIEGGREEGKQKLLFCFLDVFQFLSVAHMKISGADEHTEWGSGVPHQWTLSPASWHPLPELGCSMTPHLSVDC